MAITVVNQGRFNSTSALSGGNYVLTHALTQPLTLGSWVFVAYMIMSESRDPLTPPNNPTNDGEPLTWTEVLSDTNHVSATAEFRLFKAAYTTGTAPTTVFLWNAVAGTQVIGMVVEVTGLNATDPITGTPVVQDYAATGYDEYPSTPYTYTVDTAVTPAADGLVLGGFVSSAGNRDPAASGYTEVYTVGDTYAQWHYRTSVADTPYTYAHSQAGSTLTALYNWLFAVAAASTTPTLTARAGEVQVGYSDLAG